MHCFYVKRTLSEQAQLLDFPDVGYYTTTGDINTTRVARECKTLLQMASNSSELGSHYTSGTIAV